MTDIDLLAIVTRPDFPSGRGPIGDHLGLARYAAARPDLAIRTLTLNALGTQIRSEAGALTITQGGGPPIALERVKLALYMPVSLEVEETNLGPAIPGERDRLFQARQWRPITEYLEDLLPRLALCVNEPRAARLANNKLIQQDALQRAGFDLPATTVSTGFPRHGALAAAASLVRKNISEGAWRSKTKFSPARLVEAQATEAQDVAPAVWQERIDADHELRCYVMGDDVVFVRLERDPAVIDMRQIRSGRPKATIIAGDEWMRRQMLGVARALSLDYAVIDAMPANDGLALLAVNANGVWWFLPDEVGRELERRFHAFLDQLVAKTRVT